MAPIAHKLANLAQSHKKVKTLSFLNILTWPWIFVDMAQHYFSIYFAENKFRQNISKNNVVPYGRQKIYFVKKNISGKFYFLELFLEQWGFFDISVATFQIRWYFFEKFWQPLIFAYQRFWKVDTYISKKKKNFFKIISKNNFFQKWFILQNKIFGDHMAQHYFSIYFAENNFRQNISKNNVVP